jgi:hypothetical protein
MLGWCLRLLLIAGLLGSAWVHYDLWRNGYSEIKIVGPLFLVNAVAGVAIALLVLVLRHWLPALAAVGFGAATLAGYVLSLTVGFFNVHEQFVSQAEVWGVITEASCVVFGAVVFVRERRSAARHGRSHDTQ